MVPCCCCLSNNVRHLALLATSVAVAILYVNLVLFNFTAVLHKDLPSNLKPVASLDSLYEYSTWHDRMRRSYNLTSTEDKEQKTFYTEEEGYPILPSTKSLPTTSSTTAESTTTEKPTTPRLLFFTNSPTSRWTTRIVRSTVETTRTPSTTTTAASTTTTTEAPTTRNVVLEEVQKAIEKYEKKDKENKDRKKASDKHPEDPKKVDDIGKTPVFDEKSKLFAEERNYVLRSLLYAAPGIGCLLGTLPSMFFIRVLSVRYTITVSLFASAILQIILPFLVQFGFPALFPIRVLLGVCFSASLPASGSLTASWGTLKEQLSFISIVFVFILTGPILSWPFTMLLYSNEVDLLWIYLAHAILSILTAIIFLIFYRDQPQDHPWVNGIELNRIVAGKVRDLKTNRAASVTCSVLFRSLSAWSIWIAGIGFFSVFALLIIYLPSFLSCQQVFMVDHLGAYSVLPYFSLPLFFILGGLINIPSCSSTTKHVRINNTVAFVATSLFLIAIPIVFYTGPESKMALPLLLLSIGPLGLIVSGFLRSTTLVGRGFAQHIISCLGLSFGVAFSSIPFLVNNFIKENTLKEWTTIFLITAAILVVSSIIFAIFGRGRSAGWAEDTWDPLVRTKMLTTEPIDYSADECGLYEMRLIQKNEKH